MDHTLNQNIAECLREAHGIGETVVHNVCTGAVTAVPWGAGDWASNIGLGVIATMLALMLAAMLFVFAITVIREL